MKGLLLKEFYAVTVYCRIPLALMILMPILFAFYENPILQFYPYIFVCIFPVTLLSYDEYHKWDKYCGVLPYTKAQIVSSKYLVACIVQAAVMIIGITASSVKTAIFGGFDIVSLFSSFSLPLSVSFISTAITLPFIFRFGVAKGRTIYYFVIGALAAVCIGVSKTYNVALLEGEITAFSLVVICVISAVVFALSWVLSVAFYKKRRSV